MRRAIGLFVIWLLAIALPAQGLAAATMLHCAPQRSDASSVHASHGHHGAASAHHHHDASDQDAVDPAGTGDDSPSVKAPLQKCSACATCCIGLALPSAAQAVPEPLAAHMARPEAAVVHAAFLTSGPERPPRASRA